ncbi:MAG: hypothetical protein P8K08_18005 [Fuerstiella sp.]|jgi:hypothetical protein|nr:hypothetical protein [Fuerstiella sp.]
MRLHKHGGRCRQVLGTAILSDRNCAAATFTDSHRDVNTPELSQEHMDRFQLVPSPDVAH